VTKLVADSHKLAHLGADSTEVVADSHKLAHLGAGSTEVVADSHKVWAAEAPLFSTEVVL
jgi:hypothetical protein